MSQAAHPYSHAPAVAANPSAQLAVNEVPKPYLAAPTASSLLLQNFDLLATASGASTGQGGRGRPSKAERSNTGIAKLRELI